MIGLIVEDKKNRVWNQLDVDIKNGQISSSGFTLRNGVISEFDKNILEIMNCFKLGSNKKVLGVQEGYEVILDEDTGLRHFFKEGKEDIIRLFFENGESAITPIPMNRPQKTNKSYSPKSVRRFKIKGTDIIISFLLIVFWLDVLILGHVLYDNFIRDIFFEEAGYISYKDQTIEIDAKAFEKSISFTFEGIEWEFADSYVETKDIKKALFDNTKLNQQEKDMLWNEELIDFIVPYYNKDENTKVLAVIKHSDLDIVPFDGSEEDGIDGYVNGDGALHVKDYDENNPQAKKHTSGHEYIHTLQSGAPSFIMESSAELFNLEFFEKTGDSKASHAYDNACKYLRILMEIIGSEPIVDVNFYPASTALYENVSPYLSESQYEEFDRLMHYSPHYHKKELEKEGGYTRLYELLSIMYANKFGQSIEEDPMIMAIVNNSLPYRRVYFSNSLRKAESDYYTVVNDDKPTYSVEEAWLKGYIVLTCDTPITKEQYLEYYGKESLTVKYEITNDIHINGNSITEEGIYRSPIFTMTLANGETRDITLEEAEMLGFAKVSFSVTNIIDYSAYTNPEPGKEYHICPLQGYGYDKILDCVYSEEDLIKVEIDSILEKTATGKSFK